MSRCRSCGAPVMWAVTPSGRRMPLDLTPHPEGNVVLLGPVRIRQTIVDSIIPLCHVLDAGQMVLWPVDGDRYRPHWATCPDSAA